MLSVALPRVTVTVATGAAGAVPTVTVTLAVLLSIVALIVVEPTPIAVTTPDEFTEATIGFWLDHVATRPESRFPEASNAFALNVAGLPFITIETVVGAICTDATGAFTTEIVTFDDSVPLTAVIVAEPAEIAVTSPVDDTWATA